MRVRVAVRDDTIVAMDVIASRERRAGLARYLVSTAERGR